MLKLLKVSAFAGAATLATLGDPAFGFSQSSAPTTQQAYLKSICTEITRVRTSGESLGCEESLSDSLAAIRESRIEVANDGYCSARGLANGTPEFAQCALDRRYGGEDPPALETVMVLAGHQPADDGLRFGTFQARHRREQASCAQLGIDPGSQVFVSCVNGLEIALNSANETKD